MDKNILVMHDKEPRVGTWTLSQGFQAEHRAVRKLVLKYRLEFEEFGVVASAMQKPTAKGGRPIDEFLLNENQAMYLGTLLTNSAIVRRFKIELVKQFSNQKQWLQAIAAQQQNAEWLETRKAGKQTRLIATDTIKEFVDYATRQGSRNAEMYYVNISKMENKALFFLEQKYTNLRDILNIHQLSTVKSADMIVMKALRDGMDRALPYRDIYRLAKTRVESFAEIIGKSLIPAAQRQLH